jgi:hypothetical protein
MTFRVWCVVVASGFASLLPVLLCSVGAQSTISPPHQDLSIRLDPRTRELSGQAQITLPGGKVLLTLGAQFEVLELRVDGRATGLTSIRNGERQQWTLDLGASPAVHRVELGYRGSLASLAETDQRSVLGGLPPWQAEHGSFLLRQRLVSGRRLRSVHLRRGLDLPQGQRGLVPGRLVDEQRAPSSTTPSSGSTNPRKAST